MNVAQFNRALQGWPDQVMRDHAAPLQREILTDLVGGFVDATPVADRRFARSGHARRGWRVDLFRSYQQVEQSGVDPTGAVTKSEAAQVIAGIREKPAQLATISNPVEYIEALAKGSSKQAPAGWFEQVVARVEAKYSRVR